MGTKMNNNETIENTNKSIKEYVKTRNDPSIILNHLNRFVNNVEEGFYVLDIGSGHGRDIKYFEEHGLKPIGIDMSDEMIAFAKQQCKSPIFKLDMRDIDKVPWKFDCAWSCGALYHLTKEDIKITLQNLYSVLKPNSLFFLSIKKGEDEQKIWKEDLKVYKFYSLFSEEEIKETLEGVGFSIEDVSIENKKDVWINIFCRKKRERVGSSSGGLPI